MVDLDTEGACRSGLTLADTDRMIRSVAPYSTSSTSYSPSVLSILPHAPSSDVDILSHGLP